MLFIMGGAVTFIHGKIQKVLSSTYIKVFDLQIYLLFRSIAKFNLFRGSIMCDVLLNLVSQIINASMPPAVVINITQKMAN